MTWLQSLASLQNLGVLGYWAVFLFAFIESVAVVGLFTPGSFVVVFAGALSAQGYYDFADLVLFCIAGSILGDCLSYEFGRHGKGFLERHPFFCKHICRGQDFFKRHGTKSVLLGRFVGALRPFIPFIAGMSHMPRSQFYSSAIIGAIGWSISFLGAGFLFGTAWQVAFKWWTRAGVIGFLFIAFVMLVVYFWRSYNKNTIEKTYFQL